MGFWLAEARRGQEGDWVKRFDPRFWTVNFPRPMMASVVTRGADALRVDAVFYNKSDLAGLIWEAEDRGDHPLLAYETARDFRHCVLSFRWRSGGVLPLDALNGPTLTIEGRDGAGAARTWYVRLWNYAEGSPTDARVRLDFDALKGGYLLPQESDPVWAGDIDRMFVSLVPPDYDAGGGALAGPVEGWAEMSEIACDGSGSVLAIGDVMLPEHGLSMATGYDDACSQTPARLVRNILGLGYRGAINHYVGMSHYFRLERLGEGLYVSLAGGVLNAPCAAWHRSFAEEAKAAGLDVIWSLSYELFDAHCWNDWKQRAENGDPALTGWDPPSTLLSPAHDGAMGYLRAVAQAFVQVALAARLKVRFQVGEPWWWIMPDRRICLYDAAAWAAFGAEIVSIPDIANVTADAQRTMLDRAGGMLAASTAALTGAVKALAPDAETLVLVYLPTVLDEGAPEARRANVPLGWAKPAFDVLQLEDYDWVTQGRAGETARGFAAMTERLGYPVAEQHYFSGFVLRPEEAFQWPDIARAAEEARGRGTAATFVWALPQVTRDGFTYFDLGEEGAVQAFDDMRFPIGIGREASVETGFSTQVVTMASGFEQRNSDWADARMRYDAGPGVRGEAQLGELAAFFRARRGAARGFRFADPFDDRSCGQREEPGAGDQLLGIGDGVTTRFPLVKRYGEGSDAQVRRITRPVAGSVAVTVDGAAVAGWSLEPLGVVAFDVAPADGAVVSAGYRFDVPVRFAEDRLQVARSTFAAGEVASVPLIEVREA